MKISFKTNRSAALIVPFALIALIVLTADGLCKTWYVAHDGSGDAPTIQAAVDSASAGDSVLVGPGEYAITQTIQVLPGIVLISEEGPLHTRIVRPPINPPLFGVSLVGDSELNGFWVDRFNQLSVGEGWNSTIKNNIIGTSSEIGGTGMFVTRNCTIVGNLFTANSHLRIGTSGVMFFKNIVLSSMDFGSGLASVVCNNFFGEGSTEALALHPANISLDPQFCPGTFTLQSTSPCAPEVTGQCGLIGPLPVACGSVSVESRSWGEVKAQYREE